MRNCYTKKQRRTRMAVQWQCRGAERIGNIIATSMVLKELSPLFRHHSRVGGNNGLIIVRQSTACCVALIKLLQKPQKVQSQLGNRRVTLAVKCGVLRCGFEKRENFNVIAVALNFAVTLFITCLHCHQPKQKQ